jgi:hypothetical protein
MFKAANGCPNSYTFPSPSLHVNPAIHAEALAGIIIPIYYEVANGPSYLLRRAGRRTHSIGCVTERAATSPACPYLVTSLLAGTYLNGGIGRELQRVTNRDRV